MITCKAFRNANIANNGAIRPRGVLIYVKFSGGGKRRNVAFRVAYYA